MKGRYIAFATPLTVKEGRWAKIIARTFTFLSVIAGPTHLKYRCSSLKTGERDAIGGDRKMVFKNKCLAISTIGTGM